MLSITNFHKIKAVHKVQGTEKKYKYTGPEKLPQK